MTFLAGLFQYFRERSPHIGFHVAPLQGVGNAFIYGSSPRVRALYRGLAAKHLDCLLDDDSEDVPRCELRAGGARGQRQTELAVSTAAL